jgi:hypothetical protein
MFRAGSQRHWDAKRRKSGYKPLEIKFRRGDLRCVVWIPCRPGQPFAACPSIGREIQSGVGRVSRRETEEFSPALQRWVGVENGVKVP